MKKRRRASGHPALRDIPATDRTLLRDFERWLLEQGDSIAAPTAAQEADLFKGLLILARAHNLRLDRPSGFEAFIDLLLDLSAESDDPDDSEGVLAASLGVLDDYAHFKLDTTSDDPAWEEAHTAIELTLSEVDPVTAVLAKVVTEGRGMGDDVRRAALAETLVVDKVRDLLDWIGSGRVVAPSGGVRRADIATVAGLLGVDAVGVSKRPRQADNQAMLEDEDSPLLDSPLSSGTIYALSMNDVPLLPAWWQALAEAGVIERAGTRVRPGPAAPAWLSEELPPLEVAETVVSTFIVATLMDEFGRMGVVGQIVTQRTLGFLIEGIVSAGIAPAPEHELAGLFDNRAFWTLERFAQVGLMKQAEQGTVTVAAELGASIALSVLMMLEAIDRRAE